MIYQGRARYAVQEVILHTSATGTDWWMGKTVEEMRDEIRRWHVDGNGWSDIGYHRVVAPDGTIAIGRSLYTIGAHCRERNRGTIGICMVPVREITAMGDFEDFYTEEQRAAVKGYITELRELTNIKWVTGHNEYANKLCPGFRVQDEDWL
ncbi:N-acetylmuramoyl-L-alanine amidase [Pseudooceanicola atlanticus]|uniref:N-acetylmuramoyl-L-alanine amidase n=1 Tax=Pseudooceanicola atlanticus TaxID=1461694 RepID=UPI0023575F83|nr:N-acetylmuramoyl-L-alanine amidase [Pseudooceanicola atlanticus]